MMEDKEAVEKLDKSADDQKDDNSGEDASDDATQNQEEDKEEWGDGHLLKIFQLAAEKCIDKCLNPKQLAKCYKHVWKTNKEMLESLFQQVFDQTKDRIKDELKSVIEQEGLPNLLSELEGIMNESKSLDASKKAWRPTGNPEEDSRAHMIAKKMKIVEKMEQQYQETQQEEEKLKEQVQEKRKQLSEILSQIETFVTESKTALNTCAKFEIENEKSMLACNQKIKLLPALINNNNNSTQPSAGASVNLGCSN